MKHIELEKELMNPILNQPRPSLFGINNKQVWHNNNKRTTSETKRKKRSDKKTVQ